jgi:hypothetical protein
MWVTSRGAGLERAEGFEPSSAVLQRPRSWTCNGDLRVLPTRCDRSCPARTAIADAVRTRRGPVGFRSRQVADAICRSGPPYPERLGRGGHLAGHEQAEPTFGVQ